MVSPTTNKGLLLPQVGNDTGLWGGELNTTITTLDNILGNNTVLPSSTFGTTITLASSQAQCAYISITSTGVGPFTLNFPSSNNAIGIYSVNNATLGTVTCQSTAGGVTTPLGAATTGMLYSDGVNVIPAINLPAAAVFTTGDVKPTFKAVADAGWVFMNDGTIGSSGSNASTRANSDCQNLFILLWNNVANAYAPVAGGRGGSALADWNANKTLGLPAMLGRAMASAGTGSGLGATWALGQGTGEVNHTLTATEEPVHNHNATASTFNLNNATVVVDVLQLDGLSGNSSAVYNNQIGVTYNAQINAGAPLSLYVQKLAFGTNVTVGNAGGGGAHNNMQPTTFINIEIKL